MFQYLNFCRTIGGEEKLIQQLSNKKKDFDKLKKYQSVIKELNDRLQQNYIRVEITNTVREKIIEEAYDPRYGARPIKRYITKNIENLIAHKLIDENMKVGTTLIVDIKDNKFIITNK